MFVNVCTHVLYGMNELPINVHPRDLKESGYVMSESGIYGLNVQNGLGTELETNGLN